MGGAFRCGFGFPSFDRSLDRSLECFVVDTLDALDTPPDDAELEAEEAGFSFSPNPLWQRDAGFVQRRSPLTRKLETLKLSGPCAATTTSTGIGLNAALGSQQHSRPVSRTAAEPIARCHE